MYRTPAAVRLSEKHSGLTETDTHHKRQLIHLPQIHFQLIVFLKKRSVYGMCGIFNENRYGYYAIAHYLTFLF